MQIEKAPLEGRRCIVGSPTSSHAPLFHEKRYFKSNKIQTFRQEAAHSRNAHMQYQKLFA